MDAAEKMKDFVNEQLQSIAFPSFRATFPQYHPLSWKREITTNFMLE